MFLIIGLGNPGEKYQQTRHNAGFLALDMISRHAGIVDLGEKPEFHAYVAKGTLGGRNLLFAKPTTYMNHSGESVRALIAYYKCMSDDLILLHDDKDFDLGEIRIATDSKSAGHNGVQNIFDTLGTQEIKRVRIGIGPKPNEIPTDAYVLSNFSQEELRVFQGLEKDILSHLDQLIKKRIT